MSQGNLWQVYRRVEIWSLRLGLVLIWLGITGNHHTWVSTVGVGFLGISIIASLARWIRRRQFEKGARMGEGER